MTEAEMPRINRVEYIVLKGLDDNRKWIARDKDGCLYAFTEKPVKTYDPSSYRWDTEGWSAEPYSTLEIINKVHLFPFIQWEDEEPHNIARLLGEYEEAEYGYFNNELYVPKQVLPTIPRYVADAIEVTKMAQLNYYDMLKALEKESVQDKTRSWVFRYLDTFAKAWLYGYTIEKEKKYHAKIKGWENVTTGSEAFNWVYFKEKDTVGISKAVENKYQAVSFTKNDWNDLGINEHNADFVLEEENIK